jgi:hypothetical protein
MAQTLTNLSLEQTISATIDTDVDTGLTTTLNVGGTNTIPITTADVDIIYNFKITFDSSDDEVTWALNTGAVTQTTGTGAVIKGAGSTTYDVAGTAIPSLSKTVAIYYEVPATNSQWVRANGSDDDTGDIKFLNGAARSALLVPHYATSGSETVLFTCGGAATITVVCLAKD